MSETLWTDERQDRARATCRKWGGTPHVNRLALVGEGIDCIHFVAEVLIDAGIIERKKLPFYDERLGSLRSHNIIEDLLLAHLHAERLPPDSPAFGDLVVTTVGRQTNHLGIYIDGAMWHVPGKGRVGPEAWADWRPRVQGLVRITEPGYSSDPALLTWDAIKAKAPRQ
jgi:hypothetical protein